MNITNKYFSASEGYNRQRPVKDPIAVVLTEDNRIGVLR